MSQKFTDNIDGVDAKLFNPETLTEMKTVLEKIKENFFVAIFYI